MQNLPQKKCMQNEKVHFVASFNSLKSDIQVKEKRNMICDFSIIYVNAR